VKAVLREDYKVENVAMHEALVVLLCIWEVLKVELLVGQNWVMSIIYISILSH
jgi:hypothetical protein